MSNRWLFLALFTSLSAALLGLPSAPLEGCAVVPPPETRVQIASESAIIIWDAASKTEHFIRRASFHTRSTDFGFLVPTPSQPTLTEADDAAFETLRIASLPEVVTQNRPSPPGCGVGCGASAPKAENAAVGKVEVLEEKQVAGYDAVILKADDAESLTRWLKDHNYQSSPALQEWFKPYIAQGWKISAFKIANPTKDSPGIATKALRMSFTTDQPMYPYREPADQRDEKQSHISRLLRIYFISEGRYRGMLGGKEWHKPVWSSVLTEKTREQLEEHLALPKEGIPAKWSMTEFEDGASPRPGSDDLYFSTSPDQAAIKRPPIIRYVRGPSDAGPTYAMIGGLIAGFYLLRLRKR